MIIFTSSDPTNNPVNEFLKKYGIWLAVGFAIAVFATIVVIFFVSLKKRKHDSKLGKCINDLSLKCSNILAAIGGNDNVVSHSLNASRLTLCLKNYDVIDDKTLKSAGVNTIIKMSNKVILVMDKIELKEISSKIFND